MITAANLKSLTVKDLGQVAKEHGVAGWHGMRKDELVKAVVSKARAAKAKRTRAAANGKATTKTKAGKTTAKAAKGRAKASPAKSRNGRTTKTVTAKRATKRTTSTKRSTSAKRAGSTKASSTKRAAKPVAKSARSKSSVAKKAAPKARAAKPRTAKSPVAKSAAAKPRAAKTVSPKTTKPAAAKKTPKAAKPAKPANPRAARKLAKINGKRNKHKDLANPPLKMAPIHGNGKKKTSDITKNVGKDRIVLLVRDPYWLQACWDVSRQSVLRAQAAMAEHWHTAKPILRVYEVEVGNTTSTSECVSRDIEIHGGVRNWFVDVTDPPKSYRIELGYLAENGKFFGLSRSNTVTTPRPGSSDAIDSNWTDVAENYEKIYALSGGYSQQRDSGELQELFEERLRRPMGAPMVTRFGVGADSGSTRSRDFRFDVDAEMIIYGTSKPDAHVTLGGEPVKLRRDGTFTVRLSMPDKRQVIPAVASSADGVEQRTIVLAVERNTKVMEPMIRDNSE